MGFCDKHDNSMFQPVERQSVPLTAHSCFLLGFRAISHELFLKKAKLRGLKLMREWDCGEPFEYQCNLQQERYLIEHGTLLGLADCKRCKNQYDTIFLDETI